MTVKTVYDAAGMIVRVVDLLGEDPVRDAEIENVPVGGTSVEGNYDLDTEYFVAGVATDRPAVTVDPAYEIVADGEDSFWFDVPDETIINTPDGQFEATADSLVSISSRLVGQFTILVVPPEPYQQSLIEVTVLPDDGGSPNLPPTTPDIEILLSQTMLTNLAVLAKPKFNVVSWDVSSDPEHDHYGLTRYESEADADADTSGVDIEPIVDAFYKDADEFVNGVDCWYRVWDVDTNGNRSEKSDPVGEVARGVQTPDVEDAAITPIKAALGDLSNLVKANDMVDPDLFSTSIEGTASGLSFVSVVNANGDLGSSKNKLTFSFTTALSGDKAKLLTTPINSCVGGKRYTFSAVVNGVSGSAASCTVTAKVHWYEIDGSGAAVFLSVGSGSDVTDFNTVAGSKTLEFSSTAPASAAFFALVIECAQTGVFGNGSRVLDVGSFTAREGNNGVFETTEFLGGDTVSAGGTKIIMRMTANHTKAARFVCFSYSFKNNSMAGRAITVEFLKIVTSSGSDVITVLKSFAITLQDDSFCHMEFFDSAPSGDSTDYGLRVTAGLSSFTSIGRYMITQSFFG